MSSLDSHSVVVFFISLGVLLAVARTFGEIARRVDQPAILGELLAGIMLGPTFLGSVAPHWAAYLFPTQGPVAISLSALTTLAITLFLLVAGLEVDLSTIFRQGRAAFGVSISGIVIPFGVGLLAAWFAPDLLGREKGASRLHFTLFFATALAISALPVIAKTLMDLNLYRSDLGMIIIAAAIFDDLSGWIVFAIVLGLMGAGEQGPPVWLTITLTLAFAAFMLTIGRWLIHRLLPWIQAHSSWPGGVLGFALSLALLGAALTERIGIHAVFGAFLVGVAIGDSAHLREQVRTTLGQFISFIFAPLFFASVGLRINFIANFDPVLVLLVLAIACAGKLLGCRLGAMLARMSPREAWALGFGMNARGAMEIILGLLALQHGVIGQRLFVALVVMALVTSMISGPMMQRILRLRKARRVSDLLSARAFVNPLTATDRLEAISELARVISPAAGLDPDLIEREVWQREQLMSTGVGNSIAVPHARISQLTSPVIALGLCPVGIDFNAPDGEPAQIVFLILTPQRDNGAQVEILADIARIFRHSEAREKVLSLQSYTEFLALVNTQRESGTLPAQAAA